jgi:hypothetical protein
VSDAPPPTDADSQPDSQPDADSDAERQEIATLVGEWTTVPDIAERYRLPLSRVRQFLADRELLALRVGERRVLSIPAKFLGEAGPRPELKGTFTVLADGGMDDAEILRWLFTPDETLPVEGAPVDALIGGFKTEVRRRAQVTAL